jgi:flagellar biosynthesis chaperone FliJ
MFWMLLFLVGVLFTKYYTETIVRNLRVKAKEHQKALAEFRQAVTVAQEHLAEAEKEEKAIKSRLERLQTVIADIQVEINESVAHPLKGTPAGTGTEGK